MDKSLSKRRMAENEVVFRNYNEKIQKGFDKLKQLAEEEGHQGLIKENDASLYFYCECSDENCRKRVSLKPSRYNEIHKHRNHFVMIPGHEVKSIERIIEKNSKFLVAEKHETPPPSAEVLNETAVDNS